MMMAMKKNLATGSSPPPAPSTAPTESRSTSPAFEDQEDDENQDDEVDQDEVDQDEVDEEGDDRRVKRR